jgi:hypothetical protein
VTKPGIVPELARAICSRWEASGWQPADFPDLARATLEEFSLSQQVESLYAWVTSREIENTLIRNHPADNILTLHENNRFTIHAHLWLDGVGVLHQHTWCGAYQILSGTSYDATYHFDVDETVASSARIVVGQLALRDLRLLSPGDTRVVRPDTRHIFAYSTPLAVAISIRSSQLQGGYELDYFRPYIAVERSWRGGIGELRTRLLDYLQHADPKRFATTAKEVVHSSDPSLAFIALRAARQSELSEDELMGLFSAGRRRHGRLFDYLFESSFDVRRTEHQRAMRTKLDCSDERSRELLSLLHVAGTLEDVRAGARHLSAAATESPDGTLEMECMRLLSLVGGGQMERDDGLRLAIQALARGVPVRSIITGKKSEISEVQRALIDAMHYSLTKNPVLSVLSVPLRDSARWNRA